MKLYAFENKIKINLVMKALYCRNCMTKCSAFVDSSKAKQTQIFAKDIEFV